MHGLHEAGTVRNAHYTPPTVSGLPPLLESANPSMARAIATAHQVATFDVPILIMGESGTGKNVLAGAIHRWSHRGAGPFVTVSYGAAEERANEHLAHRAAGASDPWEDTAVRVKAAAHGTLFFEEVACLPRAVQAKLIRLLDAHQFGPATAVGSLGADPRVIAASEHDLEAEVQKGRFRRDLLFHLNVVPIRLPALRERREDLPTLTDHILADLCARHGRGRVQLAPAVRQAFNKYRWPGNVRQLVAVLEHATVLSQSDTIRMHDLPGPLVDGTAGAW